MKIRLFVVMTLWSGSIMVCAQIWGPDIRLTNDPGSSMYPAVAVADDIVHVVWHDYRNQSWNIYYRASDDNGVSWRPEEQLTLQPGASYWPAIYTVNNNLHLVWFDDRDGNYEIYYKHSTDNGITWGVDSRLTYDPDVSIYPSITAVGDKIYVVWFDQRDGNYEVYYKFSTDNGATWNVDTRLTNNDSSSFYPEMIYSSGVLHLIWFDNRDGNWEIYYKRSTNSGASWSPDIRLTTDPGYSWAPSIAAQDSNVYAVWYDTRAGGYEIYYKYSSNYGLCWSEDIRLTYQYGHSKDPVIAVYEQNLNLVWADDRDGNYEIYYKHSSDNGITWGPDIRLINNPSVSSHPGLACSGHSLHLVWFDHRDGNYEIYYKHGENQGAVEDIIQSHNRQLRISYWSGKIMVNYYVNEVMKIKLKIYDLKGQLVRTLVKEKECLPGNYSKNWYGLDDNHNPVPNGIYFCQLCTGPRVITEKLCLLR